MEKQQKTVAVLLAAGQGRRMNSPVQKQYLLIKGKPLLYYSLKAFQDAEWIDGIVLVVGKGEISYCRQEIIEKYGFSKVTSIVEGGKERSDSVYCGLQAIEHCEYVYIHDGARPFIDRDTLLRLQDGVEQFGACVAAVPAKDTIKLADTSQWVLETPDRDKVWIIQTPQVFTYFLVKKAYEAFLSRGGHVTDDAMVVERFGHHPVKLVMGDYKNIKITTPEDLKIAEVFCSL